MKTHIVPLNTLRYIDLYDVFDGLDLDMGWFYDAGVMFGENNYTLITVKQIRNILNNIATTENMDNWPLANVMLERLEGYSEETLVNLEK